MAFRKTSIGISNASVTDLSGRIAPQHQVGDVNAEGLVWDGQAWKAEEMHSEVNLPESPSSPPQEG